MASTSSAILRDGQATSENYVPNYEPNRTTFLQRRAHRLPAAGTTASEVAARFRIADLPMAWRGSHISLKDISGRLTQSELNEIHETTANYVG